MKIYEITWGKLFVSCEHMKVNLIPWKGSCKHTSNKTNICSEENCPIIKTLAEVKR